MRHGTQGHVAEPLEPTRRLGGEKEARTRGRGHPSLGGRLGGVITCIYNLNSYPI